MLNKEEFKKLANEAHFYFKEGEIDVALQNFNEVINFTRIVKESTNNSIPHRYKIIDLQEAREDIEGECTPQDVLFSNASSSEDGFFVVKRRKHDE